MLANGRSSSAASAPFVRIRCADLASSTIRNLARDHPAAFRLWLYANALWRPAAPVVLAARATMKALRMRAETFAHATRTLRELKLLTRTREASRPGAAGGAASRAAEYDIPSRSKGTFVQRSPGDPEPMGVMLADAARLRDLAAGLTPAAGCVWLVAAAQPREGRKRGSAWGKISRPFVFNAASLAAELGLPRSTIYTALGRLRELGEAEYVTQEDGRTELHAGGTLAIGRNARERIKIGDDARRRH
jgi:hypothetical protein